MLLMNEELGNNVNQKYSCEHRQKRCYNLHTNEIIERPNLYMYLGVKKTEIVRQNRVY